MTQLPSARLFLATAALLAVTFPANLLSQIRRSEPWTPASFKAAALDLPNAPERATPEAQSSSSSTSQTPPPDAPPATVPTHAAPPPATTPITADEKEKQHQEAERELQTQEKQRLLGIMPQFQVVMGGAVVPLTPGEKYRLALHTAIDPFYIGYAFVVGGGYGELVDSHSGFHWGAPGYFKRVGASYADNVDGAIIGNAMLPALLHQDPRYFRKGTGSVKSRFVYAALSTVICHGDNGKNQFNVSNVLGNFIAGAISNAYYPADERGFGLTIINGLEVTAFGAVGGQILEFGPDIARHLHKKHPAVVVPTTTAPAIAVTPGPVAP